MGKLVEADRHLRAIGAEVATLREELARLREEAGERAQLLAEREAVIMELSGLLPTLEQARVDAIREAEDASAALHRAETRLTAQGGRFAELERQLATVDASDAAHARVVAELESRVAEERAKREGTERTLDEALTRTQAAERSLAEVRARLEVLSGDHGRLLAEQKTERARAQQKVEEASAEVHASESRLSRETKRVEALEREQQALEAALAQRVAGLSELEAKLARARSEREDVKAVAAGPPDPPYVAAPSSRLTHLRFVVRAGGYTVAECDGEPPQVGHVIELDGERFVVAKTGPSPFPSDQRTCAYLLVELGPDLPD